MEIKAEQLEFELAHLGINAHNEEQAAEIAKLLGDMFGFAVKTGSSSVFAGSTFEVMKKPYLGKNGHIAIKTGDIVLACAYFEQKGYLIDMDTAKYKDGKMTAIYFKNEIAGFAFHLLQR